MAANTFSKPSSNTFILVHGGWHGGWCWNKVVPLLQNKGYTSIALDLPGMGNDQTPTANVTLNDFVEKVVDVAQEQNGQVILVGHSSGGTVIAQASELLGPEKAAKLVFLDAFMPLNGESVFSLLEKYGNNIGDEAEPGMTESIIFSADQKTCSLNPDNVERLLYHDCLKEDVMYARAHLKAQPLAALATPVNVTDQNYGAIPKYYIVCTDARDFDKTNMATHVHCEKIYRLKSSHSPFFSMPDKLADILDEICQFSNVAVSRL